MAAVCGASVTVCLSVLLLPTVTGLQLEDIQCAFSDHLQGAEPHSELTNEQRGVVQENGTVRCSHGSRCYGLWEKRPDGEIHLVKQGCWTHVGDQQECRGHHCLIAATPSQNQNSSYRFCCCNQDFCNTNFTEAPPTDDTPALRLVKTDGWEGRQTTHPLLRREETALIALVTVAVAAIVIIALFLGYRMIRGKKKKHSLSAVDVMEAANADGALDLDKLKLMELIGRGRYGTVFRGCLNERCVAVKLFSSANRQNYINERSIYCLPLLQPHDNIAHFLTADERTTADGRPEFLILMEFYPHGSLSRYLSVHTVDFSTCCRMTHGVTRGLAFLHSELYRGDWYKPAVAHRDVSSRNVLVRADLSCVLADFGLSMRLTGSHPCCPGDNDTMAISEVGTVRYMAPEVLGGAVNLRDCESALKQVDVYALGLLYWESFRRCSHLFPGEAVPEYQLAFQAELGNHPSFEEMQILVAREKFRPRFPEAWKDNSLALRSLKETMEDCWDQDAEARLTAQCAEERLSELALLSPHTAMHNHRNLSHSCSPLQVGPTFSYTEDLEGGMVKNLQADSNPASAVKTAMCGIKGAEKNRNSINYERQQAQSQARSSGSNNSVSTITAQTTTSVLCSISEHTSGAVPSVPVCLQLTEEDLEATKLDPKEVDKNLRESSGENLIELSQKQFGSTEHQTTNLLYHHILQPSEGSNLVLSPHGELGAVGVVDNPPSSSVLLLPKQPNLHQRPTSLHLLPKTKESTSASSQLKLGKLKSNHRQVETGVAKMNTVTVATAVEPHLITTVNNTSIKGSVTTGNHIHPIMVVAHGYSAGVPTLVMNGIVGGGRTNPAGPQLEEEDKLKREMISGKDNCINLLNPSPDEHEPLLRNEQLPAESTPISPSPHHHHLKSQPLNILSGRSSNSNNNNNRVSLGSDAKIQGLKVDPERMNGSEVSCGGSINTITSDSCLASQQISGSPSQSLKASDPQAPVLEASVVNQKSPPLKVEASENETPKTSALESRDSETTDLAEGPALDLKIPGLLQPQMGPAKAKRPERPCSLDLSSSSISSDYVALTENDTLSASGEKIKRRVKTPYTLKKWRPASWVVSTDTALDPDFDFNNSGSSSSQTHFSFGLHRAGSIGIPKINQSKSSMAVFLVGGGATATTTSEPDGMTCF